MTFRRGKISVTDMLRIATEFINGGTNFERPLGAALEVIENQRRFKNADIVFVTDGAAYVSDEFMAYYLQVKKKLEFQCMGCVLGGNAEAQPELEKFTDEWFAADDLMEAAEKSVIFKI